VKAVHAGGENYGTLQGDLQAIPKPSAGSKLYQAEKTTEPAIATSPRTASRGGSGGRRGKLSHHKLRSPEGDRLKTNIRRRFQSLLYRRLFSSVNRTIPL